MIFFSKPHSFNFLCLIFWKLGYWITVRGYTTSLVFHEGQIVLNLSLPDYMMKWPLNANVSKPYFEGGESSSLILEIVNKKIKIECLFFIDC